MPTGQPYENFPAPDEKRGAPNAKPSGFGPGGAGTRFNPLTATTDSRPEPGDNRPGATRSGRKRAGRPKGGTLHSARGGRTTYD